MTTKSRKLILGLGLTVTAIPLATYGIQAQTWTCEIVGAQTCSEAYSQCLRIVRKNMGDGTEVKRCTPPRTKCLATGTWKGSVCNLQGLRRV
jgi:hypothetical protein